MVAKMLKFFATCNLMLRNVNVVVEEILANKLRPNFAISGLASLPNGLSSEVKPPSAESILDNGIMLYCPVPKKRTSAEKKLRERFARMPHSYMTRWATPKTNITTCLDCGSYHEIGTICGSCYMKLKKSIKAKSNEPEKVKKIESQ